MKCPKCNTEIPAGGKFCPGCGTHINEEAIIDFLSSILATPLPKNWESTLSPKERAEHAEIVRSINKERGRRGQVKKSEVHAPEDAQAEHERGECYKNGKGVALNVYEAAKWYRKAAERGYAPAQNALGLCYRYGQGVEYNHDEAKKWFEQAAAQGYKPAQKNLRLYTRKWNLNVIWEYWPGLLLLAAFLACLFWILYARNLLDKYTAI